MLIQCIYSRAAEKKDTETGSNADNIENTELYISAKAHIQAAEEHCRMAQQTFEHAVIGKRRGVVEIEIQNDTKDAANRAYIEAELAQHTEDETFLVPDQRADQKEPHHNIARIYGQNVVVFHSYSSSHCEVFYPKIAVMERHGQNGR